MNLIARAAVPFVALIALCAPMHPTIAQDLYDPSVLRTLGLQFHDANWLTRLRNNYISEAEILADLTVDGVVYPNVGVRIRGNTSYTSLPTGSEKFSLKIDIDYTNAFQDLMGYQSLNLNNGFHDPTFSREVVYNNYVAQFIPNPRANHVLVTLNGSNWGVYINVQQADKRMLRDYFSNDDGLRIGCSNYPNGPGLAYAGGSAANYLSYQINDNGGFADPYLPLIAVTNALSNQSLMNWQAIDDVFAIDPSIWSVVLENYLSDDDSYINKGCDFLTYRDPVDNRMHLIQRDANETFTQSDWLVNRNFSAPNKPLLNRVLSVAELRQRYLAHYRTVKHDLNWTYFGAKFSAQRALIDAAVNADPKKLYSYALFQNNFTSTVNMPLPGLAGGNIVGLQQFVTERATTLNANAELVAAGPTINSVLASIASPDPAQTVHITAAVVAAGSPISKVELFYRPTPAEVYARILMQDAGTSGDDVAGDGVYGAVLPINAVSGQRVAYYVAATASNAFLSMSFRPELAELGPQYLDYFHGSPDGIRITEWMYSGAAGEFIEFTNTGALPIDMTGWSMDDDHAVAGSFALGAFGIVQPGESLIITEANATAFRAAWGLTGTVKVIGQLGAVGVGGNGLGRNDRIHLYDADNGLQDRLFYGDQTYAGTIRTQNASGRVGCDSIGVNDLASWDLSVVGDDYGSFAAPTGGDIGSPGVFVPGDCVPLSDVFHVDGFE